MCGLLLNRQPMDLLKYNAAGLTWEFFSLRFSKSMGCLFYATHELSYSSWHKIQAFGESRLSRGDPTPWNSDSPWSNQSEPIALVDPPGIDVQISLLLLLFCHAEFTQAAISFCTGRSLQISSSHTPSNGWITSDVTKNAAWDIWLSSNWVRLNEHTHNSLMLAHFNRHLTARVHKMLQLHKSRNYPLKKAMIQHSLKCFICNCLK